MTLESVFAAACIWITLGALGLLVLRIAVDIWSWLASLIRIQALAWRFSDLGYFTEEELKRWLDDDVDRWWEHHKDERAWCRYEDYREGARSAAKHLLRRGMGVHIVKMRKKS